MAGTLAPLERMASLLDAPRSRDTSPEAVRKRRRLAEALAQQATDPSGGGGSLLGAIGQGIKGFAAARMQDQADRDEADGMAAMNAALGRISAGGGSPAAPSGTMPGLPTPPGMRPGATGPGSGRTSADEVYSGLVARGVPRMVAAGMVGNIAGESNFNLSIADGRGEGSVGLIQARGPRLTALRQMGAETGRNPFSLDNQLDHIVSEFQGPESKTFRLAQTAQTPGEAALILAKHYERPAAWALRESGPKRAAAAEQVFQRSGRQAAADMPTAGAEPISFLTDPRDPSGGFFIPPDVRAQAPAGDPSAPPPGDGIAPSPPPSANPDLAALTAPQAMGPAQTFLPPAEIPAPVPQVAAGVPQDVPLPPARLAAADLMAQPTTPAPAAPEVPPAAVAQAPQPQSVPLPPNRPSDAALYAQPAADMPAPGAVPATGMVPIDPNARDAGAGAFARRQGVDAVLGGLQDGLDRIFGGPETQARLDRRQATIAALGGASQPSARAQQLAAVLDPAGASGGAPSPAVERGAPAADPRRAATIAALDPAGAQAGPSAAPAMSQGGGQVPAASIPQPTSYAQAGGMTDARRQDLLAIANSGYATSQVRQFALDQLNPKLSVHDAGDALIATDQSGNLVRTYPKTRGPMIVSGGSSVYDPNTNRELYTAPKEAEQTSDQRNYAAARQGGYGGSFNDFLNQKSQRQGQAVQIDLPDGRKTTMFYDPVENRLKTPEEMGMKPVPSAAANPFAPPGPKLSEGEASSAGFANRMAEAHGIVNGLETQGLRGVAQGASQVPVVGNYMADAEMQRYQQAKRDFATAVLRKESGAVIGPSEFADVDKKYFPQPGDKPGTIEQKRRSRETAIEGFMGGAGPNYRPPESYKPLPKQVQPSGGPARPTSQADFDRLEKGALYVDPDDGRTYRK